jgi:acetyl-CoA acetyltransferase
VSARAAVVGIGQSPVSRRSETPLGQVAVGACREAIADSGLDVAEIDGVTAVSSQPFEGGGTADGVDIITPGFISRALGLQPVWTEDVTGMVGHSMVEAVHAIAAGTCRAVLVYRALNSPSGRYGQVRRGMASGPAQFTSPYGVFPPSGYAQHWRRYMHLYGGGREQMARFIVQNRDKALLSGEGYWACFRPEPLTVEGYMASRWVSEPFCVYDCDIPVQGCGAFVLTSAERAASASGRPAYVRGVASAHAPGRLQGRTYEDNMEHGRRLGQALWANARLGPGDMDEVEAYDGFSFMTPMWLEALGFAGEGEAMSLIADRERIAADGELPLNMTGGNQGQGRLHGVPQLMEAIRQVTARAGARQVPDANLALAITGTLVRPSALIFGGTPD